MNPKPTPTEQLPDPLFNPNALPFGGVGLNSNTQKVLTPEEEVGSILAPITKEYQKKPTQAETLLDLSKPENLSSAEAAEAERYTRAGNTYLRGRDNEAVAAANQGFWSRTWNDAKALGGITGSSFLQAPLAIPQLVKSLVSLAQGEGIDKALDYARGEEGSWMRGLSEWQDELNTNTTNYSSAWARENPWKNLVPFYGGEGGNDFGSLVRSGGFILSGVATSAAETALGAALAPLTAGLSLGAVGIDLTSKLVRGFKGLSTIEKSLDKLDNVLQLKREAEGVLHGVDILQGVGKLWSGIDTPLGNLSTRSALHGLLLANGEASLEGFSAEKELENTLLQNYQTQYGSEPDEQTRARIKSTAREAGNATFLLNHALLGVSNKLQIDSILKNFSSASKVFGELDDALYKVSRNAGGKTFSAIETGIDPIKIGKNAKWYEKGLGTLATGVRATGTKGVLSLSEGLEESLQKSITDGTQGYYQYKYNHGGRADLSDALSYASKGLGEAFGTEGGWTEFVGGAVIGALFGSGIKGLVDWKNKPAQKQQAEQLATLFNLTSDSFDQVLSSQLTGSVTKANLLTKAAETNAVLSAGAVQAQAAKEGDQLTFQNQKNTAEFSYLYPFIRQGAGDVLKEQLASFKTDIQKNNAEFRNTYGIDSSVPDEQLTGVIENLEGKLNGIQKSYDRYSNLFRNPYDPASSPELYQDYEGYRDEILHNDYLRSQYGERLAKLKNTALLLGDSDWTSPEGWKAQKAKINQKLSELDQLIQIGKESLEPTGDRENPTSDELAAFDKKVRTEQREEREKLEQKLSAVEQLQSGKFADYSQVLKVIRDELENPVSGIQGTVPETNQDLTELLQASYDAKQLQKSIKKLTELFDNLSSAEGFESYRTTTDKYQKAQLAKTLQQEIKSREALRGEIVSQFDSAQDAALHLGDVDTFAAKYSEQFNQNPESTRLLIQDEIGKAKQEKQAEKDARDSRIKLVTDLVASDPDIQAIQNRNVEDPAELQALVEKALESSDKPDLEVVQRVIEQYKKKHPAPEAITPAATAETGVAKQPTAKRSLMGAILVAEDQPEEVTEETAFTPEPVAEVKPVVEKPAEQPKRRSLMGMISAVQDEEPVDTAPGVDAPPATPTVERIFKEQPNKGSLAYKYNTTGMISFGGKMIYASPAELESNSALRAEWEKVVEARSRVTSAQANGTLLSNLVDWNLVESTVEQRAIESKPLPMDPGLVRAVPDQYLVARDKQTGVQLFITPMQDTLTVQPTALQALKQLTTADKLAQLEALGSNPMLADALDILGSDGYEQLKELGAINPVETFQQYQEAVQNFRESITSLQDLLVNQTEISPELVMQLNRMKLDLVTSNPFQQHGEYPVQELAFGIGSKQLIVHKVTGEDGNSTLELVRSDDDTINVVSSSEFQAMLPVLEQSMKNFEGARTGNVFDGYYYIAKGSSGEHLYPFKVVSPESSASLLDLIKTGESFTPGEHSFYLSIGRTDYTLQVRADKLAEGKLALQLEPTSNLDEQSSTVKKQNTYYSQSIDVAGIQNGSKDLLAELNRVAADISRRENGEVIPAPITPVITAIQQGDLNRYKRSVQVSSPVLFKRADIRWSMQAPQLEQMVVTVPGRTVSTPVSVITETPAMNTYSEQLEPLALLGVEEPMLMELTRLLNEHPDNQVDISNLDDRAKANLSKMSAANIQHVAALFNKITYKPTGSFERIPTTRINPVEMERELDQVMKRCH